MTRMGFGLPLSLLAINARYCLISDKLNDYRLQAVVVEPSSNSRLSHANYASKVPGRKRGLDPALSEEPLS